MRMLVIVWLWRGEGRGIGTHRCIGVVVGSGVFVDFFCGFTLTVCVAGGGTDVPGASFTGVGELWFRSAMVHWGIIWLIKEVMEEVG
jgi:hypothetical protein